MLWAAQLSAQLTTRVATGRPAPASDEPRTSVADARRHFANALADDLDTPRAIRALRALAENPDPAAVDSLRELGGVLGLTFSGR
jgi:hypothetical protein